MLRMVYDNVAQVGDLDRTGGKNLIDDLDLETAVQISILTERRVEPGDEHSDGLFYKGGYWADAIDGDKIGSRMWLLRREKATQSNVNKAKGYIEECLQWMIDDGVTTLITVTTARGSGPADLTYTVGIKRPDGSLWFAAWEIQLNEL